MRTGKRWRTKDQLDSQLINTSRWPYKSTPYSIVQEISRLMGIRDLSQEGLKDQESKS